MHSECSGVFQSQALLRLRQKWQDQVEVEKALLSIREAATAVVILMLQGSTTMAVYGIHGVLRKV